MGESLFKVWRKWEIVGENWEKMGENLSKLGENERIW